MWLLNEQLQPSYSLRVEGKMDKEGTQKRKGGCKAEIQTSGVDGIIAICCLSLWWWRKSIKALYETVEPWKYLVIVVIKTPAEEAAPELQNDEETCWGVLRKRQSTFSCGMCQSPFHTHLLDVPWEAEHRRISIPSYSSALQALYCLQQSLIPSQLAKGKCNLQSLIPSSQSRANKGEFGAEKS